MPKKQVPEAEKKDGPETDPYTKSVIHGPPASVIPVEGDLDFFNIRRLIGRGADWSKEVRPGVTVKGLEPGGIANDSGEFFSYPAFQRAMNTAGWIRTYRQQVLSAASKQTIKEFYSQPQSYQRWLTFREQTVGFRAYLMILSRQKEFREMMNFISDDKPLPSMAGKASFSPIQKSLLLHSLSLATYAYFGLHRKDFESEFEGQKLPGFYLLHPLKVAKTALSEIPFVDPWAIGLFFLHDLMEESPIKKGDLAKIVMQEHYSPGYAGVWSGRSTDILRMPAWQNLEEVNSAPWDFRLHEQLTGGLADLTVPRIKRSKASYDWLVNLDLSNFIKGKASASSLHDLIKKFKEHTVVVEGPEYFKPNETYTTDELDALENGKRAKQNLYNLNLLATIEKFERLKGGLFTPLLETPEHMLERNRAIWTLVTKAYDMRCNMESPKDRDQLEKYQPMAERLAAAAGDALDSLAPYRTKQFKPGYYRRLMTSKARGAMKMGAAHLEARKR